MVSDSFLEQDISYDARNPLEFITSTLGHHIEDIYGEENDSFMGSDSYQHKLCEVPGGR